MQLFESDGGAAMTTGRQDKRFVPDPERHMAKAEETLDEAYHCGIDAPEVNRTTDDDSIGFLDLLIIGQQVIFKKTYLGFRTHLNTTLAPGIRQVGEFDKLGITATLFQNGFDYPVYVRFTAHNARTEPDDFQESPPDLSQGYAHGAMSSPCPISIFRYPLSYMPRTRHAPPPILSICCISLLASIRARIPQVATVATAKTA
jgi:hypothetical protein